MMRLQARPWRSTTSALLAVATALAVVAGPLAAQLPTADSAFQRGDYRAARAADQEPLKQTVHQGVTA